MENQKPLLEVVDTEKELLTLIYSKKGSLDDEVLQLYRRIRTRYENILLSSDTSVRYHETEYHLWKLHYKLIDEFRKIIIRQRSSEKPSNNTVSSDRVSNSSGNGADHKTLEKYKSFLAESADFYTNLIIKLRKNFGFPQEIFLGKDAYGILASVETAKLDTCQHSCHRLLVCLGDLVRYSESFKKPGGSDWSSAAKYYLEAAKIWPDSGNPHNQLALLARHVDDPFLALYHLVRSLFVKDPFPDAWRNILLLFDESRSTDSKSPSRQHMQFDFLNPSEKISSQEPYNEDNRSHQNGESQDSRKLELWPVLVRSMSFFFIISSFEEFPSMFASTVRCLEDLLESDDKNLFASMESYKRLDLSKKGPYRAIQMVSIFIFLFHNIMDTSETEESKSNDKQNHDSEIKPLAISSIFICMGRLIGRCNTRNQKNSCPLLPAVLVFLDWLVEKLDMLKAFSDDNDKRVVSSLSYFLVALSGLLQRMDQSGKEIASNHDDAALWEDHELRGFYPLTRIHGTLDYKTDPGFSCDSNSTRSRRVFCAASRILERSGSSMKAIHDQDQLLNSMKTLNLTDQEVEAGDEEKPTPNQETEPNSGPKAQQQHTAEEEIIVFKPITRRNSAPITETKPTVPDESLRRATSLYTEAQDQVTDSSFSFHHYQHKENTPYKDSPGPPSLSAWVPPSQGGPKARDKEKLNPIEEMPSSSTLLHGSSLPHAMPIPSAPLLPEEPLWLTGSSLISSDYYGSGITGNEGDGILGAGPRMIHTAPGIPNLIDNYSSFPPIVGMSSSEWLYHYRNSQNIAINHTNARAFGHYNPYEVSGFDSYDQWGNRFVSGPMHHYLGSPLIYPTSSYVYGGDHLEHVSRDKDFLGYELSSQQPTPLLQYLKERERQLQQNTGTQLKNW